MNKRIVAIAIMGALTMCPLSVQAKELADIPTAELELIEAQKKLDELGEDITSCGEALNDYRLKLDDIRGEKNDVERKIKAEESRIEDLQEKLSKKCATDYKLGNSSLLEFFLGSDSVENAVSNVYYAQKINEQSNELIEKINDSKDALEEEKASLEDIEDGQEDLIARQEKVLDELETKEQEQKEYFDNLSEDIKDAIEKERQQKLAEEKAAAEEAAKKELDSLTSVTSNGTEVTLDESGFPVDGPTKEQRLKIIEAAYSQLGVDYVYGSCNPGVSMDCSGLTSYAYRCAGLAIPHSAAAQANYIADSDYIYPGDLVIWVGGMNALSGNHAAIYIGGGMIIHATYSGVCTAPLGYMKAFTKAGHVRCIRN